MWEVRRMERRVKKRVVRKRKVLLLLLLKLEKRAIIVQREGYMSGCEVVCVPKQ